MGIRVEIESILQEVNLSTMKMSNHLVLKLPNGETIKFHVEEDEVTKILSFRTESLEENSSPAPHTTSNPIPSTEMNLTVSQDSDEPSFTFGGGGTQPEPKTDVIPVPEEKPRRKPTVTKDAFGYPIVQGMEGRDPGEVASIGGPNTDEDGVSSV